MADEPWQPAEQVQKNSKGEYRALIGGAWGPVSKAQKNSAGEYRAIPVAEQPSTDPLMQKVQASAPMRAIQGLRDSIDAGAQAIAHAVPEGVTQAIDRPFKAMRESDSPAISAVGNALFADPAAGATDKRLRDTETQYQKARKAIGQEGTDWARIGGNVFSPTNAAIAAKNSRSKKG